MILTNTVATSVVLNGTSTSATVPADTQAPLGYSPLSNGESWIGAAATGVNVGAAVTATATTTLDWSTTGFFQVNYPATTLAVTYAFSNVMIGQTIRVITTQGSSSASTVTWPSGIVWAGGGAGVPTASTSAVDIATITCIALGSYIGRVVKAYA